MSGGSAAGWSANLVGFLQRRAIPLIAVFVIACVGLGTFARNIGIDNSLQVWFVEGDPALKSYDAYKATFGNDETIVVAVTAPNGIYDPAYLTRVRGAAQALEALPRIRRVSSIATALHATDEDDELVVGPLAPETGALTAADAAAVRRRIAADPSFRGVLVGESESISLILVEPRDAADFEKTRKQLVDEVKAVAKRELVHDGLTVHFGGIGVVYEGLNEASMRDTSLFFGLSMMVLFIGLWVIFRRFIWVLVGVAVVGLSVIATMGLAGLAGRDMNMVTGIVPTMIMTIGILDLIHIVDAYEEGAAQGLTRDQILRTSVAVTVIPCVVNSGTDVLGFASFIGAPVGAIRDLGWMVSAGFVILLAAVLIIGIPALARFGARDQKVIDQLSKPADKGVIGWLVLSLLRVATQHKGKVILASIAVFAVSALGISRLTVDTYTIGFLPKDNPTRVDHHAIEREFGPYVPLELEVSSTGSSTLFDPEPLKAIERLQVSWAENPQLGAVTGLPDIVKQSMRAYSADPTAGIPDTRAGVTQLLDAVYGQSKDGEDNLNALIDQRDAPHRTHVTARSGLPSANTISTVIADLRARAAAEPTVEMKPSGYLPLYVRITQNITDAQIQSAGSAFLLVAIVMMLLLRSVKLGLIAMVPNLLPAVMTLAMMGFLGIPLDLATVLIAGIVIGISVNDTSHIMFRYQHELRQTPDDPHGALQRMMIGAGRPVVMGSLTLIAGFAVLLGASVKSVFYFGLLTVMTTTTALLADLLLTPALVLWLASLSRKRAA